MSGVLGQLLEEATHLATSPDSTPEAMRGALLVLVEVSEKLTGGCLTTSVVSQRDLLSEAKEVAGSALPLADLHVDVAELNISDQLFSLNARLARVEALIVVGGGDAEQAKDD